MLQKASDELIFFTNCGNVSFISVLLDKTSENLAL